MTSDLTAPPAEGEEASGVLPQFLAALAAEASDEKRPIEATELPDEGELVSLSDANPPPDAIHGLRFAQQIRGELRIRAKDDVIELYIFITPNAAGEEVIKRVWRAPLKFLAGRDPQQYIEDVFRNFTASLYGTLAVETLMHFLSLSNMGFARSRPELFEHGAGNRVIEGHLREREAWLREFYKIPKRGKPSPWNDYELALAVKTAAAQITRGRITAEKVRKILAEIAPEKTPKTAKALLMLVSRHGLKWEELIKRQQ